MSKVLYILTLVILSIFSAFIQEWVWSPIWMIGFMTVILIGDFITGVGVSFKKNQGFSSRKAMKWVFTVFAVWFVLGVSYNFPKINQEIGIPGVTETLTLFPKILYWIMLLFQLSSCIKNAALLGIFPTKVATWIIKYIDRHKDKIENFTQEDQTEEKNEPIKQES